MIINNIELDKYSISLHKKISIEYFDMQKKIEWKKEKCVEHDNTLFDIDKKTDGKRSKFSFYIDRFSNEMLIIIFFLYIIGIHFNRNESFS